MALPVFRLDGKVIMITGAGSGIGAGLAQGLACFGARIACVDTNAGDLSRTVAAIGQTGAEAIGIECDVAMEGAMQHAVNTAEQQLGELVGAVNCAGIHSMAPAEHMPLSQWQRMLDVNLTGVFLSAQAQGLALIRNGGGSIVNIGSISAHIANRGLAQAHYNAAKAAVAHLSRSLALEWVGHHVRVNVISPGYTATPMARQPEVWESVKHLIDDIPMARMAEIEELVGPAVFLLSDASSYCTGLDLLVDGGATLW